jgi:molecular chaperone DnaK
MSQEDIEKAIRDAEAHAGEDKKQKEAVDAKNHAENLIFQSEKALKDIGDKVSDSEKQTVTDAIEKLKATVATNDTEAIKADTEALEKTFYELSSKLYGNADPSAAGDAGNNTQNSDGSYNADFTDAN